MSRKMILKIITAIVIFLLYLLYRQEVMSQITFAIFVAVTLVLFWFIQKKLSK